MQKTNGFLFHAVAWLLGAVLVCTVAGCAWFRDGSASLLALFQASGFAVVVLGLTVGIAYLAQRMRGVDDPFGEFAENSVAVARSAKHPGEWHEQAHEEMMRTL